MSFKVVAGARLRKADAQVLGETFERIKLKGPLTAETVLVEAINPKSPLHRFFQWDDQKAAHEYRLTQARSLIRSIDVVIEDAKGKQVQMRGYYSVKDAEGQRSYEGLEFVFDTPDLSEQVMREAKTQLDSWIKRYSKYQWAASAVPRVLAALRAIAPAKKKKTK